MVSNKEANTNGVIKSEDNLGHKYSDNSKECVPVEWTREMKDSLLKEIDELCKSSEDSDTDDESV